MGANRNVCCHHRQKSIRERHTFPLLFIKKEIPVDIVGIQVYNTTNDSKGKEKATMIAGRRNMMNMFGMCMGSMCMCRCANFHKMLSR